jgi:hypothetical protein
MIWIRFFRENFCCREAALPPARASWLRLSECLAILGLFPPAATDLSTGSSLSFFDSSVLTVGSVVEVLMVF